MAGEKFRAREIYRDIRAPAPVVVRADGRGFRESLARLGFGKPYDVRFAAAMAAAGRALLEGSGLGARWVYTFSDELSVFFQELPFDGRVEKLDSIVPSYLSSALTLALQARAPLAFDARTVPLSAADAAGYLQWRQAEAWRNHMQSYGFYALVKEGVAEDEAARRLYGRRFEDIHEMMWQRGVNLNATPAWQRKGVFIYRKPADVPGKRKNDGVEESWDPPLFGSVEGREWLGRLAPI